MNWNVEVIRRMGATMDQNLINAANAIEVARNNNNLQKVVTAVDKNTGEVVLVALDNF